MEDRQIVTWSMEMNKANYYYIVINIGLQIDYFGLGLFYFIKVGVGENLSDLTGKIKIN